MKLINNMLGQIATVAMAEALVFGKKAGPDWWKIFEVVSVSTGNSVQFQNRVTRTLALNFGPGGTIDISYKHQVGSSLGAWGGGLIFDLSGSYDRAWQIGVLIGFAAGVVQILAGGPTRRHNRVIAPGIATT